MTARPCVRWPDLAADFPNRQLGSARGVPLWVPLWRLSPKGLTGRDGKGSLSVMNETRKSTLIASVQRALRLMEAVAAHPGGAPAKQLARETGLPLATAYHLLRTLAHEGYAIRRPDGVWVLGDRVHTLRPATRPRPGLN